MLIVNFLLMSLQTTITSFHWHTPQLARHDTSYNHRLLPSFRLQLSGCHCCVYGQCGGDDDIPGHGLSECESLSSSSYASSDQQTLASSILLPYMFHKETPHAPVGPPGSRTILWTRGVMMTFNLFLVYTSLRYLTISEFWMVNSCTPFPTAILCWFFLLEKFTRIQGICCGESFSTSSKGAS
jgi:hypothetical protein